MSDDVGREAKTTDVGHLLESDVTREMGSVGFEDLTDDWTLKRHRRVDYAGRTCPIVGDYPLMRRLGHGGMGDVFTSVHPRLGVEVAVKLLRAELSDRDPSIRDRFLREAKLAAKLSINTPHLVRVHDVDVDARTGVYFLVMEYVHGVSAARWSGSDGTNPDMRRSEHDALEVAIASTRGLCHAHRGGVIHRDIKPDNILIPVVENVPQIAQSKLADLGLARTDQSGGGNSTATTTMLGTPGFASPEQIESARSARKPADVFSMGATIYAFLTGRPPYEGDNAMARALATLKEPPLPIVELRDDLSESMVALISTCLEEKPQDRYKDAVALLEALYVVRNVIESGPAFDAGAATRVVDIRERPAEGRSVSGPISTNLRSGPARLMLYGGPPGAGVVLRHKDGSGSEVSLALDEHGRLETDQLEPGSFVLTATHPDFHKFEVAISLRPGTDAHCMLPMREREGYLNVDSTPDGASVFVDGVEVATTPTPRLAVAPGRRQLQVRLRGYGTYEHTVEVRGGVERDLGKIDLSPMGWLDVEELESDVVVLIDGRESKHGDDIDPGAHTIQIRRPGYETQIHQVEAVASEGLVPRVGRWRPNPWKMLGRLEQWRSAPDEDRERCGVSLALGLPAFAFQGLSAFGDETLATFMHADTGIEFVLLPGGTFEMGSPQQEVGRRSDERVHRVTLDPFLIARTPVTQSAWRAVMETDPSAVAGDEHPVDSVTWDEADGFCKRVGFALPTEAQWEFACRGGTATEYSVDASRIADVAWFRGNSGLSSHAVGQKATNAFGLHDVHGGVWEWCADGYAEYPFDPVTEPIGPDGADYRVFRGGSWSDRESALRSACRGAYRADHRASNVGFRPALRVRRDDLAPVPSGDSEIQTDGVPDASSGGRE